MLLLAELTLLLFIPVLVLQPGPSKSSFPRGGNAEIHIGVRLHEGNRRGKKKHVESYNDEVTSEENRKHLAVDRLAVTCILHLHVIVVIVHVSPTSCFKAICF